jgi:hypothetical protein
MQRTGITHLIFSCFVALVLLIPTRIYGWGKDGHVAIVRLAFQLMPPAQRERLYAILDTTDPYFTGLRLCCASGFWNYRSRPRLHALLFQSRGEESIISP